MMNRIFKFGLICAGVFVLCGIAFALGGPVGPCSGSATAIVGLLGGMLSGTLGAVALITSSPVLLYRKIRGGAMEATQDEQDVADYVSAT